VLPSDLDDAQGIELMPKQLFRNSPPFHAPSVKNMIVNKFSKAVVDKLGRMSEKGTRCFPKGCVCVRAQGA